LLVLALFEQDVAMFTRGFYSSYLLLVPFFKRDFILFLLTKFFESIRISKPAAATMVVNFLILHQIGIVIQENTEELLVEFYRMLLFPFALFFLLLLKVFGP